MQTESQVAALGHVIQLAVAPVFLLSGVSGLLGVLTNRLSRIIDRARVLEERLVTAAARSGQRFHAPAPAVPPQRRASRLPHPLHVATLPPPPLLDLLDESHHRNDGDRLVTRRIVLGIAIMAVMVVLLNRFFWRPLYARAERKFRLS